MDSSTFAHAEVTCPKCGSVNLITTDVFDGEEIDCSRCHGRLGTWFEVKELRSADPEPEY